MGTTPIWGWFFCVRCMKTQHVLQWLTKGTAFIQSKLSWTAGLRVACPQGSGFNEPCLLFHHLSSPESLSPVDSDAAMLGSLHGPRELPGESPESPNIILIFCDDLGYGDIGPFGARNHSTPQLDRMAAEGLRMTQFYSSCSVCTASRSSLLTGCYAQRVNMCMWIIRISAFSFLEVRRVFTRMKSPWQSCSSNRVMRLLALGNGISEISHPFCPLDRFLIFFWSTLQQRHG